MKKSEYLSVKEASEILGISPATVKNWIKLGKLSGQRDGASFLLPKSEVLSKHKELESSSLLKSRRNKSRLTSNFFPKSYISNTSPNYKTIKKLVLCKELRSFSLPQILAYYSDNLMKKGKVASFVSSALLEGSFTDAPIPMELNNLLADYPLVLIEGEDTLGMLYLSLRSIQDKKSTGAYYTPFYVVDELVNSALFCNEPAEISRLQILDPACGTGNFLLRLPDNIPLSNIHGSDIDKTAVAITRINLAIKYQIASVSMLDELCSNVVACDFLQSPVSHLGKDEFDVVLGNPPWGYVFSPLAIQNIKKGFVSFDGNGKPESFSLFIEQGIRLGKSLHFVLPETILASDYHHGIRKFILDNANVTRICYLGEAFDKVQCPSIILSISKTTSDKKVRAAFYKQNRKSSTILFPVREFTTEKSRITSENFNILASDKEYEIIEKMRSAPCFTLKDNCDFALGIVTGSNKTLLTDKKVSGSEPIIKGKDISKYRIETGKNYIVFDPEKYQQVAPVKYYRTKNKLFYRFIAAEPVVALDNEGLVSLNSANIMIPHVEGYSNAYIMAILNSSAISFYYKHTCKNMKVLRSVLEALPIPVCTPDQQAEIETLAIKLMDSSKNATFSNDCLIKRLDYLISKLYNLNTDDIEYLLK